jgi:hypothetical protein
VQVSDWLDDSSLCVDLYDFDIDLSGLDEDEREQIEQVMMRDAIVKLQNDLKVR